MRHDAIVIGGSFAGLSAAMQLARARRRVAVIDTGQPRNRFARASHGFFGRDGAAPIAMQIEARDKLSAYPNVTFLTGAADKARPEPGGFQVTLASGEEARAAKLVLAFGLVDELPTLAGLKERWGESVLHCPYCHGYEFADQRLGVLHLGPWSAHQALLIADWGPVTLFLNGGAPPEDEVLAKLAKRGVVVEPDTVTALEGPAPQLAGLRLEGGRLVPQAALYLAPETRMASPIASELGCAFEAGPLGLHIRVNEAQMTSVPGVYAAGDIARAQHNATLASADGVLAGVAAHQALVFEPLEG
jgi:thioredoxin reductase